MPGEDCDISRRLRQKERKVYADQDIDDDEIDGKRSYSVEDKLRSTRYKGDFVMERQGHEVNLAYFQEHGFKQPILVKDKMGLGMRMPSENFKVSDVKQCVGSRRQLDVMDVNTQKGMDMTMKEWVKYYESAERDKLLNVISLEFSHTKLENYVEQPLVVRQMDWVDCVWPRHLKECQTESTNAIDKMKYPKVQKYCLMSVNGCYTDFHIDMGGTSVWYHILQGEKIFWLMPPSEKNLTLYEEWVLSAKQGDIFLGDKVDKCQRIRLETGSTFFIPTGWIHAVFTPKDSLVFGGNFVHSLNIPMQLRVRKIEDDTHVPQKFRYPFFTDQHWYVLDRYASILTGKQHRQKSAEEIKEEIEEKMLSAVKSSPIDDQDDRSNDSTCSKGKNFSPPRSPLEEEHSYMALSPRSIGGSRSPRPQSPGKSYRSCGSPADPGSNRPSRPNSRSGQLLDTTRKSKSGKSEDCKPSQADIIRPVSVKLENCLLMPENKNLLESSSQSTSALSGRKAWMHLTKWELEGLHKMVEWLESLPINKKCIPRDIPDGAALLRDIKKLLIDHADDDVKAAVTGEPILKWSPKKIKSKPKSAHYPRPPGCSKSKPGVTPANIRRRRVRCKRCEPCTRKDCGDCNFCRDMRKFGGPGRMKQSCIQRQCMGPVLPNTAVCMICNKDDRDQNAKADDSTDNEGASSSLMECGICWEITHPDCLRAKNENLNNEGAINEDLPNSWECPKCIDGGKQGQLKPRVFKGQKKRERSQSSTSSEFSVESKSPSEQEENRKPPSEDGDSPASSRDDRGAQRGKGRGKKSREPSLDRDSPVRKKTKVESDASLVRVKDSRSGRSTPATPLSPVSPTNRKTSRGRQVVTPSRYL